ncbi:PPOX class F420-dependent oxidoreductase [Jatrophihabitans sp. YIM 134969]
MSDAAAIESARAFLRTHHRATMATTRADGRTQMSPVTTDVDEDGLVVVSTRETARKVAHLRRHPYAAVMVVTDAFYGEWVQVEGPVRIVPLPEAMDGLVAYYRRVSGEHPDWEDYRAAMVRDQRCLLQLTIERVGPTVQG